MNFKSPNVNEFNNDRNAANYALLIKLTLDGEGQDIVDTISHLKPDLNSIDKETERRKAQTVDLYLNYKLAGTLISTLPTGECNIPVNSGCDGLVNQWTDNVSEFDHAYVTPKQFGAYGDGLSHPAAIKYCTLAELQEVYPRAVAINEELDKLAFQKALDTCRSVRVNKGVYMIDRDGLFLSCKGQEVVGEGVFSQLDTSLLTDGEDVFTIEDDSSALSNPPTELSANGWLTIESLTFLGVGGTSRAIANIEPAGTVPTDDPVTKGSGDSLRLSNLYIKNYHTAIRLFDVPNVSVNNVYIDSVTDGLIITSGGLNDNGMEYGNTISGISGRDWTGELVKIIDGSAVINVGVMMDGSIGVSADQSNLVIKGGYFKDVQNVAKGSNFSVITAEGQTIEDASDQVSYHSLGGSNIILKNINRINDGGSPSDNQPIGKSYDLTSSITGDATASNRDTYNNRKFQSIMFGERIHIHSLRPMLFSRKDRAFDQMDEDVRGAIIMVHSDNPIIQPDPDPPIHDADDDAVGDDLFQVQQGPEELARDGVNQFRKLSLTRPNLITNKSVTIRDLKSIENVVFVEGTTSGVVNIVLPSISKTEAYEGNSHQLKIIDKDGNASVNNITISLHADNVAGSISGSPTVVINSNYGFVDLLTNGGDVWYNIS